MPAGGTPRTTVAVRPVAALKARPRLFAALEEAFPVRFAGPDAPDAGATIAFDGSAPEQGRPALLVGDLAATGGAPIAVRTGGREPLDPRLRGLTLRDPLDGPRPIPPEDAAEVLAESDGRPVWTATRGPAAVHAVASSLPELAAPQALRDLLTQRPVAMLALIELLHAASAPDAYRPPAPRAAILFDDPNLRWRTYGFIDYGRLLAHADAHGYHASMATIPLDGGRQHRATVDLFRRRPDRLSLAFHGNDHLSRELLRAETPARATAIAAQALRRIARLESRYGLRVDRVMTAPHGMCSAAVAASLPPLGFDALCAIHPLPWRESIPAERPLAGWEPAEFAAGCAVIPRLPLDAGATELALRAYLDQPLVLYGHHEDVAGGLDLLAEVADRVNRLGPVEWVSLGEIAAGNGATRSQDGVLQVRPFSHRLQIELEDAETRIALEQPRGLNGELIGWRGPDGALHDFGTPVALGPGAQELRLVPATAIDPEAVPAPPTRVWPALRRAATETRDRLAPLVRSGS
jgi:hypothetical protein